MIYHLFGKELFLRFTLLVFRERLSVCVCASSRLVLGWDVDLNVVVPDHSLSF